jgi:hypothetical protein
MSVARKPPATDTFGGQGGTGGYQPPLPTLAEASPTLSPELVLRFQALVEEVTDELMRKQNLDRQACRADAVAILVAASQHFDHEMAGGASPLTYLLLEEQSKITACMGPAHDPLQAASFLKA